MSIRSICKAAAAAALPLCGILTLAVALAGQPAAAGEMAGAASQTSKNEKNIEFGKRLYMGKANCVFCHGWAADGRGNERAQVGAPSLRTLELDRDTLIEVIACGRPGTGMPFHDRFAYTDDRCYGMKREEMGEDMPPAGVNGLQKREINAVVDYLEARIIGKPPITVAECEAFWGGHNSQCDEVEILEKQRAERQTN